MLRKLLLGIVLVSVTGCNYPPLAYEENKPQLEDAVITRDLVIFGESRVVYYTDDGDYLIQPSPAGAKHGEHTIHQRRRLAGSGSRLHEKRGVEIALDLPTFRCVGQGRFTLRHG